MYQQALRGADFRTLGPVASISLPVMDNSQLFAHAHSTWCTPFKQSGCCFGKHA